MKFVTHSLKNPLIDYVASIFHFKNFTPDHSIERVVPTGHLYILFELDGITRNTFDNETLKPNATFSEVWVSGNHKRYISISAPQNSEMFVIQFKPHGAYPFFHFPVADLNEKIISIQGALGDELIQLREALLLSPTSEDKFALAEQWLHRRYLPKYAPSAELLKMVASLQSRSLDIYQQIVEQYAYSQKHLIDQFKKYIGLTPKYYHRILRFNEILQQINKQEQVSWTQIAYQCGFSDQSHFIKEFKHFSGFNPMEFMKQDLNQDPPNFFPLDRKG